jgi:hypothetical protein
MGRVSYRSVLGLSSFLLILTGCTSTQKLALKLQEPDTRWSLSILPQTSAPLEQQMTQILDETVFVGNPGAPLQHPLWTLVADTNQRIAIATPLDLAYPDPQPIVVVLNDLPENDQIGTVIMAGESALP